MWPWSWGRCKCPGLAAGITGLLHVPLPVLGPSPVLHPYCAASYPLFQHCPDDLPCSPPGMVWGAGAHRPGPCPPLAWGRSLLLLAGAAGKVRASCQGQCPSSSQSSLLLHLVFVHRSSRDSPSAHVLLAAAYRLWWHLGHILGLGLSWDWQGLSLALSRL